MKILFSVAVLLVATGHYVEEDLFSEFFITLLFIAAAPWLIPFCVRHYNIKGAELFGAKIEFLERAAGLQVMACR